MMFTAFQNLAKSDASRECHLNKSLNASECKVNQVPLSRFPPTDPPYSLWPTIFLATLAGLLCLITVAGNLTVLLAFGLNRTLRQANNYFLVSLAVVDLLVGIISVPVYAQYLLRGIWVLGPWVCDIWLTFDWALCLASRLMVLLITLDRFLSLKIPVKYLNWRSVWKVCVLIGVACIFPVLICFAIIIGWPYFVGERSIRADECDVQFFKYSIFTLIFITCSYWIILFVMLILYGAIFKFAWNVSKRSDRRRMQTEAKSWTFTNTYDGTTREMEGEEINNSAMAGQICALKTKSDNKVYKSHKSSNSKLSYSFRLLTASNLIFKTRKEEDSNNLETFLFDMNEKCITSKEILKHPSGFSPPADEYILDSDTPENESLVDCVQGDLSLVDCVQGDLSTRPQLQCSVSHITFSRPSNKLHDTPSVLDYVFGKSSSSRHSDLLVLAVCGKHIKQNTPLCLKDKWDCKFTAKKRITLDCDHSAPDSHRDDQAQDDSNMSDHHTPSVRTSTFSCFPRNSCVVDMTVDNLPVTTELTASSSLSLASGKRVVIDADEDISQKLQNSRLKTTNQTTVYSAAAVNTREKPISGRLFLAEKLNKKINNESVNSDLSFADINNSHADNVPRDSVPRRTISHSSSLLKSVFGLHREGDHRARKAFRAISFILGTYTLCWTPYHVYIVVYILCTDCSNPLVYTITYWLCYFNSALNPFCYAFANPYFRIAFLRIMKLSWERT